MMKAIIPDNERPIPSLKTISSPNALIKEFSLLAISFAKKITPTPNRIIKNAPPGPKSSVIYTGIFNKKCSNIL